MKTAKQIRFNLDVSVQHMAVFNIRKGTKRIFKLVETLPLTDEDDVASRRSKFQIANRQKKIALQWHRIISRQNSRLPMRQDIINLFWETYEGEVWKTLNKIVGNPGILITSEHMNTFALEAIMAVDKNHIVKKWQEQLTTLSPVVEQFHKVPFNDRWIQSQFKDKENIQKMKEKLNSQTDTSTH